MYQRALERDPNSTATLCNYGLLQQTVRGKYEPAERLYLRSLDVRVWGDMGVWGCRCLVSGCVGGCVFVFLCVCLYVWGVYVMHNIVLCDIMYVYVHNLYTYVLHAKDSLYIHTCMFTRLQRLSAIRSINMYMYMYIYTCIYIHM